VLGRDRAQASSVLYPTVIEITRRDENPGKPWQRATRPRVSQRELVIQSLVRSPTRGAAAAKR